MTPAPESSKRRSDHLPHENGSCPERIGIRAAQESIGLSSSDQENGRNEEIITAARIRGERQFCWNAFLWGLGNGFISTSLIIYMINALACKKEDPAQIGLAIAWIIAAPRLIGLLRIFAPDLIDWSGSRRRICIAGYFLSPLILLLLPLLMPVLSRLPVSDLTAVFCLIGLIWGGYHLIEYFATVSLWSWIGDFVCQKRRARFLARRERAMICGQIPAMLTAGLYSWLCPKDLFAPEDQWRIYFPMTIIGIVFLLTASGPLLTIDEVPWKKAETLQERFQRLTAPIRSSVFLPILLFGAWIQTANGLTQSAQSVFQIRLLGVSMLTALALQSVTRVGQMLSAPGTARLIERKGNYFAAALALLIVSCGPLFYLFSDPDRWWLIIGAALVWIAWIGVNVGMNNLILSLAPPDGRSSYIALYFTVSTFAFGTASLIGGRIFDRFKNFVFSLPFVDYQISYYHLAFLTGWILRLTGLIFLYWSWRKLYFSALKSDLVSNSE